MDVLMLTRYMGSGGTEKVIFQLCHILSESGNKVYVCAAKGEGVRHLIEMGIEFIEVPDVNNKSPKVITDVACTIKKTVTEKKINVIHTHHRMMAFIVALIKPRGVLFINTVHNTFSDKKMLTKFALTKAQNIAVGDNVRNNVVDYYRVPNNRVHVIYNAVDDKVFDEPVPILDKFRMEGYFLVGNIGRINTQKGFEYFVDAAEIIRNQSLPIRLVIVGEGVKKVDIVSRIRDKQLEEYVIMLGFSSNVLNIIRKLDVVVLSSLWEGFPLIPIEAFSQRKTVVATDVPGTLEIVDNEENGLIVPIKNAQLIAEAIIRLYRNPELKHRLEINARMKYDQFFSYETFCSNYIMFYKTYIRLEKQ